jgi:hypothetical protein
MAMLEQERRIADLERVLEGVLELFDPQGETGYSIDIEDDSEIYPMPIAEELVEAVDLAREVLWGGVAEVEE